MTVLNVCLAEHIYVGDVSLEYQNIGKFGGFRLTIMWKGGFCH